MRIAIAIIILVLIYLILLYKYYGIQNSFEYKFKILYVTADFVNLFSGGSNESKKANVKFLVNVKNKSQERITFKDLTVQLYTADGYKIGESPLTPENLKVTILEPQSEYGYTGTIDVLVNGTTVNLISSILSGNQVKIKYIVKLKATSLGIPIKVENYLEYKK